jgi:protein-S-isoprenylcysteine O-methyltransferase Ste14
LYLMTTPFIFALILFLPAGTWAWWNGWMFVLVFVTAGTAAGLYILRVNPEILTARSRIQEGTKGWDRVLLGLLIPMMLSILPVALDDGRFHRSPVPWWVRGLGYVLLAAGIGGTAWAQAVNRFFEPGSASRRNGATRSSTPALTPSCVIPAMSPPACSSWGSPSPWARCGR